MTDKVSVMAVVVQQWWAPYLHGVFTYAFWQNKKGTISLISSEICANAPHKDKKRLHILSRVNKRDKCFNKKKIIITGNEI